MIKKHRAFEIILALLLYIGLFLVVYDWLTYPRSLSISQIQPTNSANLQFTKVALSPTATPNPSPTTIPPQSAVGTCNPPPNNTIYRSAARVFLTLPQQVKMYENIIEGQVTSFGNLVWNSPDGKEPNESNERKIPFYEQFAPVEITVNTSFKGNFVSGDKVTVLLAGAPCAKPFINGDILFPRLYERLILFVSQEQDFRTGKGSIPLVYRGAEYYTLQSDGTWHYITETRSTRDLFRLMQYPELWINATPPFMPKPSPSPTPTSN